MLRFNTFLQAAMLCLGMSMWMAAQTRPENGGNASPTAAPKANPAVQFPISVSSYDVSARNIVRLSVICSGGTQCRQYMNSELASPYTVRQGKQLVLTGYSAALLVTPGATTASLSGSGGAITLDLQINPLSDLYVANGSATNFYVESGDVISVVATADQPFVAVQVCAWGHLVDCTGGVCTKG